MKKVGIMSMQRIANYGSFLQAYALKQLIEELGCEVQFVDYHVGAPVIAENADSSNKLVRKLKKGLETFQYKAPLSHKISFIGLLLLKTHNSTSGLPKVEFMLRVLDGAQELHHCVAVSLRCLVEVEG